MAVRCASIIFVHVHSESRAHGSSVLRERARPLAKSALRDVLLQKLIDDMMDTCTSTTASASPPRRCTRAYGCSWRCSKRSPTQTVSRCAHQSRDHPCQFRDARELGRLPEHSRIRGLVPRFTDITVKALNRDGQEIELQRRTSRHASLSTKPITSTGCCSSTDDVDAVAGISR